MELYKQNEMWREELEEVLEQDHGIPRVEPPRLVSPAHSHGPNQGTAAVSIGISRVVVGGTRFS